MKLAVAAVKEATAQAPLALRGGYADTQSARRRGAPMNFCVPRWRPAPRHKIKMLGQFHGIVFPLRFPASM
jgi:hypothetical protein